MKQDHIIQKVFVEITVNNKEKAFGIKEDINSFLSMDVFPEIEKYINDLKYQLADRTIQIPRLELNLDVKSSSLNTELKDKIAQAFKEELSEITKPIEHSDPETEHDVKAYLIDNQEKMVQAFIYFLEKGDMPWWNSDKKSIRLLEPATFEILISVNSFQKKVIPVLSKSNVQNRIINQLSNEQIVQLCLAVLDNKEVKINLNNDDIVHLISKLKSNDRIIVWRLILELVSKYLNSSSIGNLKEYFFQQIVKIEAANPSQVKNNRQNWKTVVKIFPFIKETEILDHIKNNLTTPDSIITINNTTDTDHTTNTDHTTDYIETAKTLMETIDQENDGTDYEDIKPEDGKYVQNAGLILIHPFLKTFFEHCDLLDPKTQQLIDPELCAHLLHYIATGNINAPEYEMIFEKFLCNIPLEQPINRHIKLSRKHKTQAKNVIESVQHNWSPMKKSSIALLQNEFFQRSGKLEISNHDYILTVERKTQDILLDRLSWGIGLVKLPWQKKFIFINW